MTTPKPQQSHLNVMFTMTTNEPHRMYQGRNHEETSIEESPYSNAPSSGSFSASASLYCFTTGSH
ncbi:hypothetical protein YC2023_106448 [Brassica napus]